MFKTLLALAFTALTPVYSLAFDSTDVPVSPNGTRATISLPTLMHQRNTGGSDGSGLCVFTSAEMAGWGWQNLEALKGFQKWMEKKPGGGWPEKFDDMLKEFCDERGIEVPPYVQHVGGDSRFLELCLKTRRAPCITYAGNDGFYNEDIWHMVVLSHLDANEAAIIDNNRPGKWIWMSRDEQLSRWHLNTVGKGWAYVFLTTPPPPVEDEAAPVPPNPKPKPKPKPKPRRPLFPRWNKIVLGDGEVIHKLFDGDELLGTWQKDGWHPAVTADGWTIKPEGVCPVEPPATEGRYFTNGGEEVTSDFFTDDSNKPYITAVVKDEKEKAALLKALKEDARYKDLTTKAHFNLFVSSWWAASNVKHNLTVQVAGSNKAVYFNDVACPATVFNGLDAAFPKPIAPEPRPKVEPKVAPDDVGPPVPVKSLILPDWVAYGLFGSLLYGAYYVCKR